MTDLTPLSGSSVSLQKEEEGLIVQNLVSDEKCVANPRRDLHEKWHGLWIKSLSPIDMDYRYGLATLSYRSVDELHSHPKPSAKAHALVTSPAKNNLTTRSYTLLAPRVLLGRLTIKLLKSPGSYLTSPSG
jgi:hypothetical protein